MSDAYLAMLIDPQGNTMRFQTDTLDYDDLGPEKPFGPEFDLGSITSIETAYAVEHPKPKLDGYLSMLGGAAMGGVLGAAIMGYFYAKDRGRVVCYTNVKLAGHGDTVFKFIADEPIVDKVFLIIEEGNYFGHREPNRTPRCIRWLENVFRAIGLFFRRLLFTVIAILVLLVIIALIFGKFPEEEGDKVAGADVSGAVCVVGMQTVRESCAGAKGVVFGSPDGRMPLSRG